MVVTFEACGDVHGGLGRQSPRVKRGLQKLRNDQKLNYEMIMTKRFIRHRSLFVYDLIYNKKRSDGNKIIHSIY